jgi:hypothetical protein
LVKELEVSAEHIAQKAVDLMDFKRQAISAATLASV